MAFAIQFDDVKAAAERLRGVVHYTPILRSKTINALTGREIYFKCENVQRAGSFKLRGAYNALAQLSDEAKQRGVVAFSSGNHAQGVALAAKLMGIPATIVMPTDAPKSKLAATQGYGADIHFYDRLTEDRVEIARVLAEEQGRTVIPSYDHPHIMAGQGTAALELLEIVPDLDTLVVPVGGGGLLSGCVIAAKALQPNIRIFGVETEASNDWYLSFRANERVKIDPPDTIADGMRTLQPGELTYPIIRAHVEEIVLVSEADVIDAMKLLLFRTKLLAEPTGAVAPAAVLQNRISNPGQKVGVIISGGNVDDDVLAELLTRRT
jgi:threonine dehydratase